jgi:hypothetical protein
MSPIFVRPVREQAEHDRLIRFLLAKYKRKFEGVAVNVGGEEQATPVKIGPGTYFPDIVLTNGKKLVGIAEVESAESVNNLEAMAQWVPFSRSKVSFALFVPVQAYEVARRLCDANQVSVSEIWTYRPTFDGFDLIRMFQDAAAERSERARADKSDANGKSAKPDASKKAAAPPKKKPAAKPVKAAKKPAPPKSAKKKKKR